MPPWSGSSSVHERVVKRADLQGVVDGHTAPCWMNTQRESHGRAPIWEKQHDRDAARVVAAGGGIQAVIDATGLAMPENVGPPDSNR